MHTVWPALLGANRGRYFLLTGQRLSAAEGLQLGIVNEVLPADELLHRARTLAGHLVRQPPNVLRYTRTTLIAQLKREMVASLDHGLAMEGLGAYESWPSG